jgi:hypothetical protein
MNAMGVVVMVPELSRFPREVHPVPEKHAIEKLTPDRPDQPFDERMRDRRVRNRLHFPELEDAQVGEPTVASDQWVVIGAEVLR